MIANDYQYKLTKAQAAKFERALAQLQARSEQETADLPPRLRQAEEAALRSQWESLEAEIAEYESLRSGQRRAFVAESFEELPQTLIQARIAAGLTQKQLADRLGLKEQQVQRYEATGYASASLKRVKEVIQALGLSVREEIALR
jgi:ribosome-binding protein aMBF1 (putative translation factor)